MRRRVALHWCEGKVFDRAGDCGLLEVDTPWSSFTRGLSKRGAREAAARFVLPPWRRKLSQNGKTKKETHLRISYILIALFFTSIVPPQRPPLLTLTPSKPTIRQGVIFEFRHG